MPSIDDIRATLDEARALVLQRLFSATDDAAAAPLEKARDKIDAEINALNDAVLVASGQAVAAATDALAGVLASAEVDPTKQFLSELQGLLSALDTHQTTIQSEVQRPTAPPPAPAPAPAPLPVPAAVAAPPVARATADAAVTPAARPASGAPALRKGFDANQDCGRFVSKIVAAKVDFVVRYYSHNSRKNLSFSEAKVLSGAGVNLVTVWESDGDHAGFFTRQQGVDDATSAQNLAVQLGQPADTPIYFAVDFDATQSDLNSSIIPYFRGVAAGMNTISHGNPPYTAGVYGSGLVCATLFGLRLVTHTWLSMSSGFAGSKTYKDWNIRQHLEADPFGFGFTIDPNEAQDGYGGFMISA